MVNESKKVMESLMTSKPYIRLKNVSKVFGKDPHAIINLVLDNIDKTTLQNDYNHIIGLQNINIDIPKNKIQVFMGLSGSGKSTLIRHLNQLIRPTHGEIIINGVDVTKLSDKELMPFRRQNFAMVFQKFALLPHRTVLSNTYFGLQIKGKTEDAQKLVIKNIVSVLESEGVGFDIGSYRDAPPGFRIWGGGTVEQSDIESLLPWLEWGYAKEKYENK